jgi:hypothetical protein
MHNQILMKGRKMARGPSPRTRSAPKTGAAPKANGATKTKKFVYKKPTVEQFRKRASGNGSKYDRLFKDSVEEYKPREEKNRIRALPPFWENPDSFNIPIWIHYDVGPDNNKYFCLRHHGEEPHQCPMCDESDSLKNSNDEDDYAEGKNSEAKMRYLGWVIDRMDEQKGPLLWNMPVGIDREIHLLGEDDGSAIVFFDDDEGFDVEYVKTGKGLSTKYVGTKIVRHASPLSDDPEETNAWLTYVSENLPQDVMNVFDYNYVATKMGITNRVDEPATAYEDIDEDELDDEVDEVEVYEPDDEFDDDEELEASDDEFEDDDEIEDEVEEEAPVKRRTKPKSPASAIDELRSRAKRQRGAA